MKKSFLLLSLLFVFTFVLNAQDKAEFQLSPTSEQVNTPPSTSATEVEINYDGVNTNGVGAADANFIIAARFTSAQTGTYFEKAITKVRIYIRNATVGNTGVLKLYGTGTATTPGDEIHSQNVNTVADSWNEFTLNQLVGVPSGDLWVGLQATAGPTGTQFWGGVDAGPNNPNGQFIYFNNAWATLTALNAALTYNWNIRAVVNTAITVPVELTSFSANVTNNNVTLEWTTATETNNQGFEIQRKIGNSDFQTFGFVHGNGTTTAPQSYSYIDANLIPGNYTYRLKQVDFDGASDYSNEIEVEIGLPTEFSLGQNYPNPFNPSTTIEFSIAEVSFVNLKIFNLLGQEVATLLNNEVAQGVHQINFDASNLNSGVYFYQITAKGNNGVDFSSVKKMILNK